MITPRWKLVLSQLPFHNTLKDDLLYFVEKFSDGYALRMIQELPCEAGYFDPFADHFRLSLPNKHLSLDRITTIVIAFCWFDNVKVQQAKRL
jgi:hypothetical protein